MNSRELSERLDQLATRLEGNPESYLEIVEELKKLSNQEYAPGNSLSWDAVKPKAVVKSQGGFISGKRLPF